MDILTEILGIQAEYNIWNKKDELPLYIAESYVFWSATLNGCRCIIIEPVEELTTLPAIRKQIIKIRKIENVPVVIKVQSISSYRRKSMISSSIPFITDKQVFLPFLGAYLEKYNNEPREVTKFTKSTQQLVLLYLYIKEKQFYISKATGILPYTAMTMSRAVKQLEATGLFEITKDGVSKVIESKYDKEELYDRIKIYMVSPVREIGYIEKKNITGNMVLAGTSALAEETMINDDRVKTFAVFEKAFDKALMIKELVEPDKQVKLELWRYDPMLYTDNNIADPISLALSFENKNDERIEEAVEKLLENIWRNQYGNRICGIQEMV